MLNRRGFTLIEMLLALGVVAVLATLALPSLSEALHRTRQSLGGSKR